MRETATNSRRAFAGNYCKKIGSLKIKSDQLVYRRSSSFSRTENGKKSYLWRMCVKVASLIFTRSVKTVIGVNFTHRSEISCFNVMIIGGDFIDLLIKYFAQLYCLAFLFFSKEYHIK